MTRFAFWNTRIVLARNHEQRLGDSPQRVSFDLSKQGLSSGKAKTLLTTELSLKGGPTISGISLGPFGVFIGDVTK